MIKTNIWFGFIVIMTWIMISATNIDLFKTVAIKAGYLIFPEEGNKDIYILKSGEPLLLEQPGSYWMSYDGYMESRNNIHLMASKAIEDGDFLMKMKLELDSCKSSVRIMAGDNQLGINLMSDDVPEGLYFEGPSLGKTIHKETDLKDILPTNKTITLEIWFEDDLIECKIEGISVLSASVVHKSFGRIGLNGWIEDGYFRVYEWIINAELVSLEQCYSRERLLNRAQRSVDLKAEEVKDDPNRPAYHIQPPANWNNDPNGTLFYNGYYHVFYQHNPFDDQWNWMHWGHVRSKNLVEWEHLPIALWPSLEKGENHCFSGSAILNRLGEPMLFYTSIGYREPEQWVAIPVDDELLYWEKHPENPILTQEDHRDEDIRDWRDPQLIHEGEETFMVIGGHPENSGGSIMLYKALNENLTEWEYLGTPFSGEEGNWECPNFFRIGEKWIIIYSPHSAVRYYTGIFNLDDYTFQPEKHGWVDHGMNFYAPNTMEDDKGRRLLLGWIPGFKENQGWQGAITIPRQLSISPDGWLIQKPVEELQMLRTQHSHHSQLILNGMKSLEISNFEVELLFHVLNISASKYGIRMNTQSGPFEISVVKDLLLFGEKEISLAPYNVDNEVTIRLFFDRTIMELFLNGGIVCATGVVYPDRQDSGWEVFAEGGEIRIKSLDIWELRQK